MAQDNQNRLTVVGVGAQDDLDYAKRFVDTTGVTFTMLWSDSFDSWRHYDIRSNSSLWLIDSGGNRVGDTPLRYQPGHIEDLLDSLA